MRNNLSFHEIVGGNFGRKTSYANVEKVTEGNILKVMGDTIGNFNFNKRAIQYLWNYKKGNQPALYRTKTSRDDIINRVVENHAWEIVRFKNGQTYGEPVQYVSLRKEDEINKAVDTLNDYMRAAGKARKDIDSGEWTSAVGTGYKAIQRKNGDIPFRIIAPSPMNTYAVYSSITEEHILSVQELKDENDQLYYLCYSDTHEFIVKNGSLSDVVDSNGNVVKSKPHGFGGIPIIEYPNNQDRISDIELVYSMLDAINTIQSNRVDGIEQFVQSWVKFVNCEVDRDAFEEMKMMGALVVKSNNGSENKADVDIMTQELNQSQTQVSKDDLWDSILDILAMPNKHETSGGDTQGAIQLRNGWDQSKQAAKIKDQYITESDNKLGMLAINQLRLSGIENLPLTPMDFETHIIHSPTDNMLTKTESLQMLLQSGINPQIAIDTAGLWTDSEKVFLNSKPYLDAIYKTSDQIEKESAVVAPEPQENEPQADEK